MTQVTTSSKEKETDRERDIKNFDKNVLAIQYVIIQKRYGPKKF